MRFALLYVCVQLVLVLWNQLVRFTSHSYETHLQYKDLFAYISNAIKKPQK